MQGPIRPERPICKSTYIIRNRTLNGFQCYNCGDFFEDIFSYGSHWEKCEDLNRRGICSTPGCECRTDRLRSRVNLCTYCYDVTLEMRTTNPQKEFILSTFRNGWLPPCHHCQERRRSTLDNITNNHRVMCQECYDLRQERREHPLRHIFNRNLSEVPNNVLENFARNLIRENDLGELPLMHANPFDLFPIVPLYEQQLFKEKRR